MKILNFIKSCFVNTSKVIGYIFDYKWIFKIMGLFLTRKFEPAKNHHKYGILIAARNEEKVIGKLLESIQLQDYPSELIDVFVVADNCTDDTAKIAQEYGATVYSRTDTEHRTKGYALNYLVKCIDRDFGVDCCEAYFLFDADNLLAKDYVSRMNDSFDAGEKIVTSYRNTKNFGDNWISASYGLHWLRTVRNEHRARSFLHLATRIQGTGFLFANELIADGWNYTSLTEDRAFCSDAVVKGYAISFNYDAVFYDEQPTDIKTAMRQRIRWAKGHLQAFAEYGGYLFKHIIIPDKNRKYVNKNFLDNLRYRFMSFDMLSTIYPRSIFLFFKRIIVFLLSLTMYLMLRKSFGDIALLAGMHTFWAFKSCYKSINIAIYVFFIERKRIEYIPFFKKLWYCITFPLFDLIGRLSMVIALFSKVEWKPIEHKESRGIDDLVSTKK